MRGSLIVIACCIFISGCSGGSTSVSPASSQGGARFIRQNGRPPVDWAQIGVKSALNGTLVDIASGPDKSLWFTDASDALIGHVNMTKKVATSALTGMTPTMLAVGARDLIYFDQCTAQLGTITPGGVTTTYQIPSGSIACGAMVKGLDGNVWFSESGHIGKITRAGHVDEYKLINSQAIAQGLTNGPDGALWFTEQGVNAIERIDPTTRAITSYDLSSAGSCDPVGITTASDGNVWFGCATGQQIGAITTAGTAKLVSTPFAVAGVRSIREGPDGNPWFVSAESGAVAEYDATTGNTTIHTPPAPVGAASFDIGPDGNIWLAEGKQIGVFIVNVMTVSPTSVEFSFPHETTYIDVTEPGSPTLSAVSSNPKVATAGVLQGQQAVYVTSNGAGMCFVTISDAIGNSYRVPVTVQ